MKKEKYFVYYDAESDQIFLEDECRYCDCHSWLYSGLNIHFLGEL